MSKGKQRKIITPNQAIIGSKSKNNKKALPDIEIDKEDVNYEEYRDYNSKIEDHPEIVEKIQIRDNYALVRLFKFEEETKSDGGIILEDLELYSTEGGQIRSKIKHNPYQKRGIIVKLGHVPPPTVIIKNSVTGETEKNRLVDRLLPGTIVHLPSNDYKEFHVDKTKKVDIKHGYFLINVNTIECIESK